MHAFYIGPSLNVLLQWPGLPPFEEKLRKHRLEYTRAELAYAVVSVIYTWWKRMATVSIALRILVVLLAEILEI